MKGLISESRLQHDRRRGARGEGGGEPNVSPLVSPQIANRASQVPHLFQPSTEGSADTSSIESMVEFLSLLRNRRKTLASFLLASFALAGTYLAYSPPRYLARAAVLIESSGDDRSAEQRIDEYKLAGHTQIIGSDAVARSVVEELGLTDADVAADDVVFPIEQLRAARAWLAEYIPEIGSERKPLDPVQTAVETIRRNLSINRAPMSPVVEVAYTSADPARAASIPNAYIAAYIAEVQQQSKIAARTHVTWLEKRLEELRVQVAQAERAVESFRSNSGIAGRSGLRELEAAALNELRTQATQADRTIDDFRSNNSTVGRAKLKELEAAAQTLQVLYKDALREHALAVQRLQSESERPARVLVSAKVPLNKSQPRTLLVLGFAGAFGLTFGIGAVLLRERLVRGFDTLQQIETHLNLGAIGCIPKVRNGPSREKASPSNRVCAGPSRAGRVVLDAPRSRFAETIRSVHLAAEAHRGARRACIIGVISTLPGEGRGAICTNLAQLIEQSGSSVLVIDADMWEPKLSATLTGGSSEGLAEVLSGTGELGDVLWTFPSSGAHFLPAGAGRNPVKEQGLVSSEAMGRFIDKVAELYDYVILRLPPAGIRIDAAAAAKWADAFVLVIEWRTTTREAVAEALRTSKALKGKVLGAVLNKVSASHLKSNEKYKGKRYFRAYHS